MLFPAIGILFHKEDVPRLSDRGHSAIFKDSVIPHLICYALELLLQIVEALGMPRTGSACHQRGELCADAQPSELTVEVGRAHAQPYHDMVPLRGWGMTFLLGHIFFWTKRYPICTSYT